MSASERVLVGLVVVAAAAAAGLVLFGPVARVSASPLSAGPAPGPASQVELDRIVSRVNGRIITQSDVRQARMLKLVDDTSSDDATRRALENRWLILAEITRAAPLAPATAEELSSRRSQWEGSVGSATRGGSMGESDVQAWLRDDLRIRAYLDRQFGMLPETERDRARAEWLARLRQRAELD